MLASFIQLAIMLGVLLFLPLMMIGKLFGGGRSGNGGGMFGIIMMKGLAYVIKIMFKIVFTPLAWLVRKIIFMISDYTGNSQNEDSVKNILGFIILGFSMIFIILNTNSVISNEMSFGVLDSIVSFVGFFMFALDKKVQEMPFLRKNQNMKKTLKPARAILFVATASAGVAATKFILADKLSNMIYLAIIFVAYALAIALAFKINSFDKENIVTKQLKSKLNNNSSEISSEKVFLANNRATKKPMYLDINDRFQHMQIIGGTGSGKTIFATNLATQDILANDRGVIIMEPTKDFVREMRSIASNIGRKYYYVDPAEPNGMVLNPLDSDNIEDLVASNLAAFEAYLGPNANDFYKRKQSNALAMGIKVVKETKGNKATYFHVLELLRPNSFDKRREALKIVKNSMVRDDLSEYSAEFANEKAYNTAVQNHAGLLDYLRDLVSDSRLAALLCGEDGESPSNVSIGEVMKNGEILLITTAYADLSNKSDMFGRLVINLMQKEIFRRSNESAVERLNRPPVAVFIDEFQNYVNEPIAKIFTMGRKCRVMMNIIHQNLSQLGDVSKNVQDQIYGNARNKAIFGGDNADDYETLAKRVGQSYQKVNSRSSQVLDPFSVSTSTSEQLRFNLTGTEIMNLKGYQGKKGEPAEALFLTLEDNVFNWDIGLVSPIPRELLNMPLKEEQSVPNGTLLNVDNEVIETIDSNTEKMQNNSQTSIVEDYDNKNEAEQDVETAISESTKPKRKRGARGRGGKGKKNSQESTTTNVQHNENEGNEQQEQQQENHQEEVTEKSSLNLENEKQQDINDLVEQEDMKIESVETVTEFEEIKTPDFEDELDDLLEDLVAKD